MEKYDALILTLGDMSRFKQLKDALIGNKFTSKQDLIDYIYSVIDDKEIIRVHTRKIKKTVTKVDDNIELVMDPYMDIKNNRPRKTKYNVIVIFSIKQSLKDGRIWFHRPIGVYASKNILTLESATKFRFPIKVG